MNKKLQEHRRLFGDLEVVDMVDTEAIEKLRGNISSDVPLKVNWTWDYGNEVGIAASNIFGIIKSTYNAKDFATWLVETVDV